MNIFKRAWIWLITKKEIAVTDTTASDTGTKTTATVAPATSAAATVSTDTTETTTTTTVTTDDSVLAKVKELLISIGHDVEEEFDEVVALAKKLVTKTST